MRKVLILTASTGWGHNSAAKAIARAFNDLECADTIIDGIRVVNPLLDKIIGEVYENSAKYTPNAYGTLYKLTDNPVINPEKEAIINSFLKGKLKQEIEKHQPDLIVGTHPFPLMAVARMKEMGEIKIPIISVLTDYTTHASWFKPGIDAYIVGAEDIKYTVEEEQLCNGQVYPFGIPVDPDFLLEKDLDVVKEKYKLEDMFTVMLMGGSFGAGNLKEMLCEIAGIPEDIQIVAITGRNQTLKQKLETTVQAKGYKHVKVLGFSTHISELMSISNLLVSKPGGLTLTEALLKHLPLVIPFYIPGGEEENLDFLLNNGLVMKTTRKYPLKMIVRMLKNHPHKLKILKERMKEFAKPNAARDLAKLGLELMDEYRPKALY